MQLLNTPSFQPPQSDRPLLDAILLEDPLIPAGSLALLAIACLILAPRFAAPIRAQIAGAALAVAAIGIFTTATLVTTTREAIANATSDFIQAVETNDHDRITALTRESITISLSAAPAISNRDQLLTQSDRLQSAVDLRSLRVAKTVVQMPTPNSARVYANVRISGSASGVPLPPGSWWEFRFTKRSPADAAGPPTWQLASAEAVWMTGNANPSGN